METAQCEHKDGWVPVQPSVGAPSANSVISHFLKVCFYVMCFGILPACMSTYHACIALRSLLGVWDLLEVEELRVGSCHVSAGSGTQILWESSKGS